MFTEKTWEKLAQYGENLLIALLVLIVGLLLTKLVLKVARKVLDKSSLDESVYKFLLKTIKYGLYLLIFVVVLTCLHVPTAPLVTVLGACGAAIALALKDSLGNIASGIIILVNQPFIRGDVIEVAGVTGIVQSIDLMVTTLRTFDNKSISIPNATITASVLVNHTRETTRRVDCKFGVSYDADLAKVKDILMTVAASCTDVLPDPQPFFGIAAHKDSAVEVDFKVWCKTSRYWDVKYYLEEQVKYAFDEANITIPFPQRKWEKLKNSNEYWWQTEEKSRFVYSAHARSSGFERLRSIPKRTKILYSERKRMKHTRSVRARPRSALIWVSMRSSRWQRPRVSMPSIRDTVSWRRTRNLRRHAQMKASSLSDRRLI